MGGFICSNPSAFEGLIALGAFLAAYGLQELAGYFDNPAFSLIAAFVEQMLNEYAKDAAFAGVQQMIGGNPLDAGTGLQLIQWGQQGAPTTFEPGIPDPYTGVGGQLYGLYGLANQLPVGIHWSNQVGPTDVYGQPGYVYTLGGNYIATPTSTSKYPVIFRYVGIPAPLDPAVYQQRYGFPPPTNDQLAAFLVGPGVPQLAQISPSEQTSQGFPAQSLANWISAYRLWWIACGGAQPGPPPPGGGGGGVGTGPGPLPPWPWPTPTPCQPNPPQDSDDLTTLLLCGVENSLFQAYELYQIATALNGLLAALTGGKSGEPAGDCCNRVVQQLTNVAQALSTLASTVKAIQPKVDVDVQAPDLSGVIDALKGISSAISNAPTPKPTDVQGIVDQLKILAREGDVPQVDIDYLVRAGFIPPELGGLFQGKDWAGALFNTLWTKVWAGIEWVWGYLGFTWRNGRIEVTRTQLEIADIVEVITKAALATGAAPMYGPIKGLIDGLASALAAPKFPALGVPAADPDLLLAKSLGPVLVMNAVGLVADYLGWELSEQLVEYVEIVGGFVGLEEIEEAKIGLKFREGIVKPLRYQAQRDYRQWLPGVGELAEWTARGIVPRNVAEGYLAYNGVLDGFFPAIEAAGQQGIRAFMLIRLLDTGLFSDADLTDELTFGGMRPASQARMKLAAPYLATQSERNSLRTELETAYVAGLIDDQELTSHADAIEHNFDRVDLVMQRARIAQRVQFAKNLETGYSKEFQSGLIDLPTYQSKLQGIGLTDAKVANIIAESESAMNASLHRKMEAAERALTRATAAVERRAAIQSFKDGIGNVVTLAAALAATGLTVTQAVAWADLAALQKMGNVRWTYGMQLTPARATIVRQQVAALIDQRKRQLLTDDQFSAQLQQLGIQDPWLNALRAAADATLTPASTRFLLPVQTS